MNKKEEIIKNFDGKVLGVCNYKKDGQSYVDDFLDHNKLLDFLYELESGESTLTKTGFNFLEQYYSLDDIAEMLLSKDPDYPFSTREDTVEWLKVKNQHAIDQ